MFWVSRFEWQSGFPLALFFAGVVVLPVSFFGRGCGKRRSAVPCVCAGRDGEVNAREYEGGVGYPPGREGAKRWFRCFVLWRVRRFTHFTSAGSNDFGQQVSPVGEYVPGEFCFHDSARIRA